MYVALLPRRCTDERISLGDKPPRIDVTRFAKSVTIKAGRPLDLEIPFEANPAPTMIWLKDGKPIQPGGESPCQTAMEGRKCKLNMYVAAHCPRSVLVAHVCLQRQVETRRHRQVRTRLEKCQG